MVLLQRRFLRQPPWVANNLWQRAKSVPSLDLRFADTKSLTDAVSGQNLITFTRASSGTYVGSDGLIKTAAVDEPRFDHNPATRESLGLLIEEQRTNLSVRSEELNDASWGKLNGSVTQNVITAPNGTLTADKFTPDTTSNYHYASVFVSNANPGAAYTYSVFCKDAGYRYLLINSSSGSAAGNSGPVVDLQSGTVAGNFGSTYATKIDSYPDGWFRVSYTYTANNSNLRIDHNAFPTSVVSAYTGDGASGIYIWGAQLEQGSFPTSYIKTEGSTVTRSADVASITGANFTRWYRQDSGTLYAYFKGGRESTQLGYGRVIGFGATTFTLMSTNGTSSSISCFWSDTQARTLSLNGIQDTNYWDNGGSAIIAYGVDSTTIVKRAQIANSSITPTSSGTTTNWRIGASNNGANALNGTISRLTYWQSRLPNTTLQDLTR